MKRQEAITLFEGWSNLRSAIQNMSVSMPHQISERARMLEDQELIFNRIVSDLTRVTQE